MSNSLSYDNPLSIIIEVFQPFSLSFQCYHPAENQSCMLSKGVFSPAVVLGMAFKESFNALLLHVC